MKNKMLTRKRKRENEIKPPQLPLELWVIVTEQIKDSEDFLNLMLTIPSLGLYSLRAQEKFKTQFTIRDEKIYCGRKLVKYILPNGTIYGNGIDPTIIHYWSDTTKKASEEWYKGEHRHRNDNLPATIIYREDGKNLDRQAWYEHGKLRIKGDLPCEVKYWSDSSVRWDIVFKDDPHYKESFYYEGTKYKELWYKDTKLHREDGPAHIEWWPNGNKREETWYTNGLTHRNDDPAVTLYYIDGTKEKEDWYVNGTNHRIGAEPAETQWWGNGEKRMDAWWKDGINHREDGPAIISYTDTGAKKKEEWFRNGRRHRDDGPAIIAQKWFRDGVRYR